MHDIKAIRDNPAAFDTGLARRGLDPMAAALLMIDAERRDHVQKLQDAQARRNAASKEIGDAMKSGDKARAEALKAEMGAIKDLIASGEAVERDIDQRLGAALAVIPNIPLDDVPDGKDESGNVEVRRWGTPGTFAYEPRQHFDIGEWLGLMDFEAAAKISGARFVVMKGQLARLERAVAQFMLDHQTGVNGYTEHYVPFMVNDSAMYGTGQLPKFAEDLFRTTDGRWLIPTAEVPLTNFAAQEILAEADLPIRLTALSPCFRSEAGSAGRDTRGMLRQHQFAKVELVSIVKPEDSDAEHERMTRCAERVLTELGLVWRRIMLCAGDTGFGAARTYDLEVWLPGQQAWREISSCSNCRDFQARRMGARYRPKDAKGTHFLHTLNGSGVAVGRALIAVLETHQQADGTIAIPEVLRPYMGGMARIGG